MDNLTHSLAGALLGEASHDLAGQKKEAPNRRTLLITASIISNNFPDLDGVYTNIMPAPLGYLLHHRGHTHTILLVIPQLLLIFGLLLLIPSFRRQLKDRHTLKLTALVVGLGLLIHMLLDSWNSYGIHPFYPFSSRWLYGDLVFIVEPYLWFAFAAPLFMTFKTKWARALTGAPLVAVPLWAAANKLLSWYSVFAVLFFALITYFIARKSNSVSKKIWIGIAAAALFLVVQTFSAVQVRQQLTSSFSPNSPQHKILDLVLTPLPANPLCWSVLQLESDTANDKYYVEGKMMSAWPSLLSADKCISVRAISKRSENTLSEISSILSRDCFVDAWMRFARAPLIESNVAFDVRYAFGDGSNFSALKISESARSCPRFIPPWSKPRQDLLDDIEKVSPIKAKL